MLLIRTESISGLALKGLHLRLQSPNLGLIADRSASRVICSSERKDIYIECSRTGADLGGWARPGLSHENFNFMGVLKF